MCHQSVTRVSPNRTLELLLNENNKDREDLTEFIDFVKCILTVNPKYRWSAEELLGHPFMG
jgi:serine/threonine protein kinase